LIVPLNVLVPILLSHDTKVPSNHDTSSSGRNTEFYWEPHGGLIRRIHEHRDVVQELFEEAEDYGFTEEDFCVEGVEREEFDSRDDVFCGGYRVKPFPITRYFNENPREWLNVFSEETCYKIFEAFDISENFLTGGEKVDVPF
jgi:hypothetical protein